MRSAVAGQRPQSALIQVLFTRGTQDRTPIGGQDICNRFNLKKVSSRTMIRQSMLCEVTCMVFMIAGGRRDSWPAGSAARRSCACDMLKMAIRLGRRAGFSDSRPDVSPMSSGLYLPGTIGRNCPEVTLAFRSVTEEPSKGTVYVMSSYSRQPRAQRSAGGPYGRFSHSSGGMYCST